MTAPNHRTALAGTWPLAWIIAWRYIRGRRSQMLSSTALAAYLATSLGVMAMVVAMALMSGYTEDLRKKLIGLQGEVIASPMTSADFEAARDALEAARSLPEVVRMGRVAYAEGSLASAAVPEGISIELQGVDPEEGPTLLQLADPRMSDADAETLSALLDDRAGIPNVVLGKELQRRLEVAPGDSLRLVILVLDGPRPRFKYRSVRCAGSFSTGFAEFDARWVLADRQVLLAARGRTGAEFMAFKLTDPDRSEDFARRLGEILGPDWFIQEWTKLNKPLFAALELQEWALFWVIGLIPMVATFNVASTLMILVRERMHDVGVFAALGLAPHRLWWVFAFYGLSLGAFGIFTGVALGAGASWVLTHYELIRFDPEVAAVYFIESVPFRVEWTDVAAIVGFALAVTLVACCLPAWRAASIRPADALRDE